MRFEELKRRDNTSTADFGVGRVLRCEWELLKALPETALKGVTERVNEIQRDPSSAIGEVLTAMTIGAGIAYFSKNPKYLASAVGTLLPRCQNAERVATTIKNLVPHVGAAILGIDMALRVAVPMIDVGLNPNNLDKDKELLGYNLGSAVVDYSLMGLAGSAGAMAADITPPAINSLRHLVPELGRGPKLAFDTCGNGAAAPHNVENMNVLQMAKAKNEAFDGAKHPKYWEQLSDDGTKTVKKWLGRFRVTQTKRPDGHSTVDAWTIDARGSKISLSEETTPEGILYKSFNDGTNWTLRRKGNSIEVVDKSANVTHTVDKKTGLNKLEATLQDGTVVQEMPDLTGTGRICAMSRYYQVDGTKVELMDWTVVVKSYGDKLGTYDYTTGYGGSYNPGRRRRR